VPRRIPAHDLEKAAVDRLLEWLQTPTQLLAALRDETTVAPEGFFDRIIAQAGAAAQSWRERIAADRTQFMRSVIERVVIQPACVEIRLRVPALVKLILGGGQPKIDFQPNAPTVIPRGRKLVSDVTKRQDQVIVNFALTKYRTVTYCAYLVNQLSITLR